MNGSISQKTLRRLLLHAQLLDGRAKSLKGKAGAAQVIDHLGYVQIDTIAVIERAHQHTLWTRLPGYRPEHLHQAQAVERTVFEYWGHAASYLPMKDYRFYLPMMKSFYDPKNSWFRGWGEKYGGYLEPVLKRIREEGPLAARDFENPPGRGKGPWWDWKPAKAALELLFWRGELMIAQRRGFERVYDLSERVLPAGTGTRVPGDGELGRFLVQRALGALGVAGEREIRDYIRIGDRRIVASALEEMLVAGEIVRLGIEDRPGVVYALPALLATAGRLRAGQPGVRFLSPFDNLAIDRRRLKERFDFDFAFECYVPKHKRVHGYFVLPILFGENIVGRLDPKADRQGKTLIARFLAIEPAFTNLDGLVPELGRALGEFARFNGCARVVLENVRPARFLAPLKKALAAGAGA
ncbi:MAG: winged helix DNA-binding domain-containing protein [Acidobacteria bacterium]|jgi:hypothetical protein|nr:winged helix DNA-binding domain-containing protein [Acidobacteriota bacterium]